MTNDYKICARCIMDTTVPEIQFDIDGVCNYCREYEERVQKELHYDEAGQQKLKQLVNEIKKDKKDKEYDCIIGLSGGLDSTMVAYHTVKTLGLRPLAIHLDNGWNSEIAVRNIENIAKKLDIDLHIYKVDWEEFRDLQLSFLKASVRNIEIPTDHAIVALLYHTAAKKRIRYIFSGGNIVTEGIVPKSWGYFLWDWKYIKGIHKKFGKIKLKKYPHLSLFDWVYYIFIKRIKFIPILNYIPYVKKDSKELLKKELGWEDYGGKHCESVYTRFFQSYILPKKFNIDKRRAYLSNLVRSGQMTREEALEEISHDPYPTKEMMKKDKEYVIKKLGLTEEEFERIMSQPIKTFKDYPNNYFLFSKLRFFVNLAKKITRHNY
ncbi:MAG: ExsB family protein [Candidatus Cloacimonas sp. 4484_209]|nr:MAG: ExsB family protein [Candidatus Cloacimonas sp. 4484_209]